LTDPWTPLSALESEAPDGVFRPIIFGEALFDHFPDGTRVLGGAPFNVAWHLKGFKADPLLVTAVGRDREGEEILDRMRSWQMDTSGVQIHPTRPTGQVTAHLEGGQPRFEIEARQAYDGISIEALPPLSALESGATLYHGTLCLREETSSRTLDYLKGRLSIPRLVDVNLRDPWWDRESVRNRIKGAGWVKVNEDELGLISGRPVKSSTELGVAAGSLRDEADSTAVFVTMGAKGALAVTGEGAILVGGLDVTNLADTVGAGDAFSAVLTLGIRAEWSVPTLLHRAVEFATELCRRRGATSFDPDLYTQTLKRWNDAP
jgi:fructokinase